MTAQTGDPGSEAAEQSAIDRARAAALKAYAPYSGFHVGCIVETIDGDRFEGANMENASYGLTMCAEVGALTAAQVGAGLAKIARIYVAGGPLAADGTLSGGTATTPCGRCRQLIAEAASVAGRDIEVVCASGDGKQRKRYPIRELLPDVFGPQALRSGDKSAIAAE